MPVAGVAPPADALWSPLPAAICARRGVGLAARRVGHARRVIVRDAAPGGGTPRHGANTVLVRAAAGRPEDREASRSLHGPSTRGTPPVGVELAVLGTGGRMVRHRLTGTWGRSAPRQVSPLDGLLAVRRLDPILRRTLRATPARCGCEAR